MWWQWALLVAVYVIWAVGVHEIIDYDRTDRPWALLCCVLWPLFLSVCAAVQVMDLITGKGRL